jgi:hypothetical protein
MSTPNVEDVYGLSPMQFGMLFDSLRDGDGISPYQVQMVEKLTGPLDDQCFLDAWQHLVDRHAILRSAFLWEEVSTPVQVVQRTAELPRAALDWREHDPATQDELLRRLLADDWREGFDLSRPPLLRVRVVRTADESRLIVWSFHHILLDGWSIQVLKKELFEIYQAAVRGKEPGLPPAIPFLRYATWLHEQPAAPAREFWREYLRGMSEPTELPVTRHSARRGVDEHVLVLDQERSHAVRRFAREQRVTVNTVVQGVWSALLSRYSGHDDVLFGATTSGRSISLAGVESMVGLFINTLPVRVGVDGRATVADWRRGLPAGERGLPDRGVRGAHRLPADGRRLGGRRGGRQVRLRPRAVRRGDDRAARRALPGSADRFRVHSGRMPGRHSNVGRGRVAADGGGVERHRGSVPGWADHPRSSRRAGVGAPGRARGAVGRRGADARRAGGAGVSVGALSAWAWCWS